MATLPDIDSREKLEAWLQDKPREWAQVIASRAALRVLPRVDWISAKNYKRTYLWDEKEFILLIFRANLISSAFVRRHTPISRQSALAASQEAFRAAESEMQKALSAESLAFAALSAYAAADAANFSALYQIRVAANAVEAASNAAGGWLDVGLDAQWLVQWLKRWRSSNDAPELSDNYEVVSASELADNKLWAVAAPDWVTNELSNLGIQLGRGGNWQHWLEWYYSRLNGSEFGLHPHLVGSARDDFDYYVATQPTAWWARGADDVNADIVRWIEGATAQFTLGNDSVEPDSRLYAVDDFTRTNELGSEVDTYRDPYELEDDAEHSPVEIPPLVPASLEPEWIENRLTLPTRRASHDLKGADIDAVLSGLKRVLTQFSDDLEGDSNVDRRFVAFVKRLAADFPDEVPDQVGLFSLAHNGDVLSGYISKAKAEWEETLAVRLGAISLQFDRTMDKFPAWRAFKAEAPLSELDLQSIEQAVAATGQLAAEMVSKPEAVFIDPAIAEQLAALAEQTPVIDSTMDGEPFASPAVQRRAFDMLESASNILKRLLEAALWVKGKAGQLSRHTWEKFSDGVRKEYPEQVEALGKSYVKWVFRILKAVPAVALTAAGANGLGLWLAATFPAQFAWLGPILKLLGIS